ncbi:MAG: hypothetical protein JNN11_04130 [Candidatus Doudnabacteria bacterium]|nr:hypothetical protein [Candidatus Doudnabacteria bacterium]
MERGLLEALGKTDIPLVGKHLLEAFEGARRALGHRVVLGQKEIEGMTTWDEVVGCWIKAKGASLKTAIPAVELSGGYLAAEYRTARAVLTVSDLVFRAEVKNRAGEIICKLCLLADRHREVQFNSVAYQDFVDSEVGDGKDLYRRRTYMALLQYLLKGSQYESQISAQEE